MNNIQVVVATISNKNGTEIYTFVIYLWKMGIYIHNVYIYTKDILLNNSKLSVRGKRSCK